MHSRKLISILRGDDSHNCKCAAFMSSECSCDVKWPCDVAKEAGDRIGDLELDALKWFNGLVWVMLPSSDAVKLKREEAGKHIAELQAIVAKLPSVPRALKEPCGVCNGDGECPGFPDAPCHACEGEGTTAVKCEVCLGEGEVKANIINHGATKPCDKCKGHGYKTEQVPVLPGDEIWHWEGNNRAASFEVKELNIKEVPMVHVGTGVYPLSDFVADKFTASKLKGN